MRLRDLATVFDLFHPFFAGISDVGAPARDPDAGRDTREAERGAGSLHAVRLQRELELGDAPLQHRPAPHRIREGRARRVLTLGLQIHNVSEAKSRMRLA